MSAKRDKDSAKNARSTYKRNRRNIALSIVYGIFTCLLIVFLVFFEIRPQAHVVHVGEIAGETIYAIGEVEDPLETQKKEQAASDAVGDVYVADENKTNEIILYFNQTVFDNIKTVANYGYTVRGGKENTGNYIIQYDAQKQDGFLKNELSFVGDSIDMIKDGAMTKVQKVITVLDSDPKDVQALQEWFIPVFSQMLQRGISEQQLQTAKNNIAKTIIDSTSINNAKLKQVVAEVIEDKLTANAVFDQAKTEEAKQAAIKNVQPVIVPKGTAIVTENTIVTQNQVDMLNKLGMLEEGDLPYALLVGSTGMVFALLAMVALYLWVFENKIVTQHKKTLLLCLLVIVNILIALLLKSGGWQKMMNAAISTILIALLFDEQIALIVNTMLSVILALFLSDEAGVFSTDAVALIISSLAGGTVAIHTCKNVRNGSTRGKMLIPGVTAGVVGMVTAFLVMWAAGKEITACLKGASFSLLGGILAAIFSSASLPVWESMFGLITQSKLLELSNSSSDLLRKISVEIPGTYQHSSAVAEMAENGAKDIGANPMLAKTAALYHDIGKLRCPECYTENQTPENKNYHDRLSPKESTEMIFSHISEGVKIAKSHKLPQEVIDVILQHHGTSAVQYFYNKAKQIDPLVNIDNFRYPGPNPQTKEAGIILLADCIEASVRSMDEKTPETIKAQIEKMFKARMDGGELDDCELTLKDINVLKQSFLETLSAMYHTRIKYDNQEKKDGSDS